MKVRSSIIYFFLIVLLSISVQLHAAIPYFNARSQSANTALEMVGQEAYINRYESNGNYTVLSLTPAFFQSFRADDIACCIFGPDLVKSGDCSQLTISGSGVSNRGTSDWLADYFGLPTDFKSAISFKPQIRNILLDMSFYFGLDEWWHPGMFFKLQAPFVHTRWDLEFSEKVSSLGTANHPFGYFNSQNTGSSQGVARSNLLNSFQEFVSESKVPDLTPTIVLNNANAVPVINSTVFQPLQYARIASCNCSPLTRNGLADLRFTLGYNPYLYDAFHVGFGLTGAAPTGNKPHGEFVFEPMIGNGNHWELGGQLTAHYKFWKNEAEDRTITAYFDINLTHLFTARQVRSFDLKGKPNSRYMLAQEIAELPALLNYSLAANELSNTDDSLQPIRVFSDIFTPIANLSTVAVKVTGGVQVDMSLMFNYTSRNMSFDIGYNLWARSCERIKIDCSCPNKLTSGNRWALKGDAHVYGFDNFSSFYNPAVPISLSATQSQATIHQGTNVQAADDYEIDATRNPGVDFARPAITTSFLAVCAVNNLPTGGSQTFVSKTPVFLEESDLDLNAAATRGLSHKVFAQISYRWLERNNYVPFIGFGASAEFADTSAHCCKTDTSKKDCSSDCKEGCDRCGLSQWGVWIKGGFSFD